MFWHNLKVLSVIVVFRVKDTIPHNSCDLGLNTFEKEDNLGQLGTFPWLGVIRAHLHEGAMFQIAVTGAVLVKDKYAIANADDIAKIPKKTFRDDSKAFFVPNDDLPWTSPLKEYVTHPEYEYSTYNTIALVELKLEHGLIPVLPICFPDYLYNASNQLYALGYTDENKILEKVAYQVQYVEKSVCNEFYERSKQQNEHIYVPTHYQCGFAVNNKKNCVWENGMALVSNSSESWVLIGLGIRGPGCGAPARFIELFPYIPWIESLIDMPVMDYPWRKSLQDSEFSRKEQPIKDISIHTFFRNGSDPVGKPGGNWFPVHNGTSQRVNHIAKDAVVSRCKYDSPLYF